MKIVLNIIVLTLIFGFFTFNAPKAEALICGIGSDDLCEGRSTNQSCKSGGAGYLCVQDTSISSSVICTCDFVDNTPPAQTPALPQNSCPGGVPAACPAEGQYEPDFDCVVRKFQTGGSDCCINKRIGVETNSETLQNLFQEFDIFNTKLIVSYQKIPTLINLVFSTVIGALSLYAAIRGIIIYAYKLPNSAGNEEDVKKVSKEAQSILFGFILLVSFVFIIQVIFSILGLPALNELDFSSNPNPDITNSGPGILIQ